MKAVLCVAIIYFLLFWFTAGANQGGSCWCLGQCQGHGAGDPPTGGGGPPQGSGNQH